MFSVDNFYEYFCSNWGWHKTKNLVMVFQPHGSKDLHNLESFGIDQDSVSRIYKNSVRLKTIVMHDQEPLFLDYLDTYRTAVRQKKIFEFVNDNQKQKMLTISNYPSDLNASKMFIRSAMDDHKGTMIFCHSELNSKDVETLEKNGAIGCYYWWHGMIARDWFRHWQYYNDLFPRNKSKVSNKFLFYARDCTGTRNYRQTVIDHFRKYQDQVLHAWDGNHVDSSYSAKISIPDAMNSSVHIVAETLFDTDKIYLTEKIFKPMVMSQPFILFGPPKSLEYLRNYGFRTFGDFWDESYDLENDSDQRMSKLLDLIDNIASMSAKEFHDLYQRLLPVIEHNRQRFYSEKFQDDLILELRLNMERALFEQNQCHQHRLDDESSADGNDV